jgi:hypothetical protein
MLEALRRRNLMLNRFYKKLSLVPSYVTPFKNHPWKLYESVFQKNSTTYFYRYPSQNSSLTILTTLKHRNQAAYFHAKAQQTVAPKTSWACLCSTMMAAGFVGALGYYLYWSNTKKPVIAASILKTHPQAKHLLVVDSHEFSSAGPKLSGGRSGGHKVERINAETGEREYFYYKEVIDRRALLNELVVGGLARELCGPEAKEVTKVAFPLYLLHETSVNNAANHSRYGVLSESVGKVPHGDLEKWSEGYFHDHEFAKFQPKHLGVALALDGLVGKSDCKLANLVGLRDQQGACYSIDHESAFAKGPQFIDSAERALGFIGEFRAKTLAELGHEDNCPGLDTRDDPNQPLKSRIDIQVAVRPILLKAIQNDLENGSIAAFYKKFVALTDEKLKKILGQYGLLTESETLEYFDRLKFIQDDLRKQLKKNEEVPLQSPLCKP